MEKKLERTNIIHSLRIEKEMMRRLKAYCALKGITIKKCVTELIEDLLSKQEKKSEKR
jgi:hypothetical protein